MEDINQSQYIIVEDIGKYYPIEILEVEGITIHGKKIGELDELIFTKARELGGTRRDFNIVYKKSHTRHYVCSQMTIERIVGDIAALSEQSTIGFKRKYKLAQPKRVWAHLQYIPHNGAYRTKKGDIIPYKITDVYRLMGSYVDRDLLIPDRPWDKWDADYAFEMLYGKKCNYDDKEQIAELQRIKHVLEDEDELSVEKIILYVKGEKAYRERASDELLIK